MCGLTGFLRRHPPRRTAGAAAIVKAMGGKLHHRGPDHCAEWLDEAAGIALAHARLAIVELSPAGDQPMVSKSGRYFIVYNGEIYNHMDLRDQIEASGENTKWRGHSDTETLLAAIETWGIREAIGRSTGMFALALWDRHEKALTLARDRLGEKPLYYGWQGKGSDAAFLFGSELKALASHPSFEGDIDRDSLALFMRYAYVPAPYSIYRGLYKLPPGSILTLSGSAEISIETYWSATEAALKGAADPLRIEPEEVLEETERVLGASVRRQMMSDVPLGAFLSGGVDSSMIVALMQAQSSRPVKSFSIGFHEPEYNEANHASAVAKHLGTDHTELYVGASEAMAAIPGLGDIYDEPFADASQIPTLLVCGLARQHVTVALSGDGGDELFGGYRRYGMTQRFWRRMSKAPRPLRSLVAHQLRGVTPASWGRLASTAARVMPASRRELLVGDKMQKAIEMLDSSDVDALYRQMISVWRQPENLVLGSREPPTVLTNGQLPVGSLTPVERMMALDSVTYLPDDILTKLDRAAMSVSLETRVPLLDHTMVEFAWRVPMTMKERAGESKWPLRQLLYKYVPRTLVERPKQAFMVPVGLWLRGPLREWAEALLDEKRLRAEGFLNAVATRGLWNQHLSGLANLEQPLWTVLMFQSWLEGQRGEASRKQLLAVS